MTISEKNEPIIEVKHLSKQYKIGVDKTYKTLSGSFTSAVKHPLRMLKNNLKPNDTFWALKDVNFEVERGEVLGIIGRNGAGKSTLLKVLSRITYPTEGEVRMRGRVGSLLEVGTGFHPELSGRENIYFNGAIMGMKKKEIDERFDDIVKFSGVEKFLDTPIKRYSSGMQVRLAFSVAAHLEPEILVVDEVLAVGDVAFQKKCMGKMNEVAANGRTVLFVSHNIGAVRRMCKKAMWIDHGQIMNFGITDSVIENYLSSYESNLKGEFINSSTNFAMNDRRIRLLRISIKNHYGVITDNISIDSPFSIEFEYELITKLENLRVGYRLLTSDGTLVFTSVDTDPEGSGTSREPGIYISRCTIPGNFLNNDLFYVTVACDRPMEEILFFFENIISFTVSLTGGIGGSIPDGRLGVIRPALKWEIYSTTK